MEAACRNAHEGQALFAPADALYATMKTSLSSGGLMHAPHDEVDPAAGQATFTDRFGLTEHWPESAAMPAVISAAGALAAFLRQDGQVALLEIGAGGLAQRTDGGATLIDTRDLPRITDLLLVETPPAAGGIPGTGAQHLLFVLLGGDEHVFVYDAETGAQIGAPHLGSTAGASLGRCGTTLWAALPAERMAVWLDPRTGMNRGHVTLPAAPTVWRIRTRPDGQGMHLLAGGRMLYLDARTRELSVGPLAEGISLEDEPLPAESRSRPSGCAASLAGADAPLWSTGDCVAAVGPGLCVSGQPDHLSRVCVAPEEQIATFASWPAGGRLFTLRQTGFGGTPRWTPGRPTAPVSSGSAPWPVKEAPST